MFVISGGYFCNHVFQRTAKDNLYIVRKSILKRTVLLLVLFVLYFGLPTIAALFYQ